MKKALLLIAVLSLLIFTGCAAETVADVDAPTSAKASANPVDEGAQEFVDNFDEVELGEML